MPDKPSTTEQLLAVLAQAPQRLAALTDQLTPDQLRTTPNPDEWSANDVLAHMRACADVWGNCIATILAEDMPTIRAINPRTWIKQTNYLELEFQPSLYAFAAQRADLVVVLASLPPDGWSRAATVTGAGRVLQRTMLSYAEWLASHERPHIKQIARIAKVMQK